ncbi:hypothetical protein Tco_0760661 [Tanacetum coccineum]
MTSLADKAILSGAENSPPMLEKDMYDSWKSRMKLYMMNRQHGRMILESVENGPLIWPSIEENGVTRPKKYSELSATEAIQADCDIKATNIILQGLPPEVYALVSNHKVAKELWERIQLLMQGTSLTKQERECKLYDEFDKFAYKKGETLRDFYLRFSLLLNDMNIYNMKLEQFQVNTKFLNTLPPEWSKFMTDVKLVQDLHTTNIDQLHAYLGQHEFHANEVRLMHERNSDPLALSPQHGSPYQSQQYSNNQSSTPLSITYPSNDYQSSVHHNVYSPPSSIPQLEYAPTKGDDPIDAINYMMSFLTAVVTTCYPTTNNQLRNSLNPRQQAAINDGRATLQLIQGRHASFAAGTTRTFILGESGRNSGKQRIVICYKCKGEGYMSKQCTKPKRKRNDSWFKDKVLLVQAQENGNRGSLIFSNNGEGNMSLNWLDGVCCGWQTSSGVVALGVEMGLLVLVVSNHVVTNNSPLFPRIAFTCFWSVGPYSTHSKRSVSPLNWLIEGSDNSSQERHHVIDGINGIITFLEY